MTPDKLNLDNDSFDFSSVEISETRYYAYLRTLSYKTGVVGIEHSLPMNSISVHVDIDKIDSNPIHFERDINRVYNNTYKKKDVMTYELRTTRFLSEFDENDSNSTTLNYNIFNADYSDRHMGYIKSQVDLYDCIEESTLVRSYDRLKLMCLTNGIESTGMFLDLMNNLGFTISSVEYDKNKLIHSITFEFDDTTQYSSELVTSIVNTKTRKIIREKFEEKNVKPSCGHELYSQTKMVNNITKPKIKNFDSIEIDGEMYYEIPVRNPDDIILNIDSDDVEKSDTNSTILFCHVRRECNKIYVPDNVDCNIDIQNTSVEIPYSGEVYVYNDIKIPF